MTKRSALTIVAAPEQPGIVMIGIDDKAMADLNSGSGRWCVYANSHRRRDLNRKWSSKGMIGFADPVPDSVFSVKKGDGSRTYTTRNNYRFTIEDGVVGDDERCVRGEYRRLIFSMYEELGHLEMAEKRNAYAIGGVSWTCLQETEKESILTGGPGVCHSGTRVSPEDFESFSEGTWGNASTAEDRQRWRRTREVNPLTMMLLPLTTLFLSPEAEAKIVVILSLPVGAVTSVKRIGQMRRGVMIDVDSGYNYMVNPEWSAL